VLLVRGRLRHYFGKRLMMRQLVMGDLVSNFMGSLVLFILVGQLRVLELMRQLGMLELSFVFVRQLRVLQFFFP
jgi:hypothetical protein